MKSMIFLFVWFAIVVFVPLYVGKTEINGIDVVINRPFIFAGTFLLLIAVSLFAIGHEEF